jgi:hypothetical protein
MINPYESLDRQVRRRLRHWPQHPPGIGPRLCERDAWMRGRPCTDSTQTAGNAPFLKLPGSNRLRTLPDGLWLNFGGTMQEPFVDIFAVEACGSLSNLLDKRSRFSPTVHSLMTVCPVPWLLGPFTPNDPTPRWHATGVVRFEPTQPLVLPVRDIRVMYALSNKHYDGFVGSHMPHAHEYYVPMDAVIAVDGDKDPALQAMLAHATASAQFLLNWTAGPGGREPSLGGR